MHYIHSKPGRTCVSDNKEYLFFSGYAYLGMQDVPMFNEKLKEGIDKYGILFPSSRVSNTRLQVYTDLEKVLTSLTGMEDTVCFSSGFLAGNTIQSLMAHHQHIFIAPGTHPAVTPHSKQIIDINTSFDKWAAHAVHMINVSDETEYLIICDSINTISGELTDLSFLNNISPDKTIIVLIDDSHGMGLLGNKGEGIISTLPQKPNVEYIISYSLSKAFHLQGGAVSCSAKLANKLRAHPAYVGSTAISPALIYAFLQCQQIYVEQRKKLKENIVYIKSLLHNNPFIRQQDGLPLFIINQPGAADILFDNGILISSFPYPYPSSPKVNRFIISALHTKMDMDKLASVLKTFTDKK